MWLLMIALGSIVTSLVTGRALARAASQQSNPRPVRGPALDSGIGFDRLAVGAAAARMRMEAQLVHLN